MTTQEESFFKQRKNLIACALLVSFINVAGGELKKLNLLGNEIVFSNPRVIPIALGISLVYFLIRYVQYAHDVHDKGFRTRFLERASKHMERYLLKRQFQDEASEFRNPYQDIHDVKVHQFIIWDENIASNNAFMSICGVQGGVIVEDTLMFSHVEVVRPFLLGFLYIIFRTRLATDYLFPLFLAAFAVSTYSHQVREMLVTLF